MIIHNQEELIKNKIMITQILITIYLMIGSYLVGKEIYRDDNPLWFYILKIILGINLLPILYLLDFIKYFDLWVWWKYFTDKNFGKDFKPRTINFLKKTKPKHKLDALLRKKILKRIEK